MAEEEVKEDATSAKDVKEDEVASEDKDEKDVPWKNRAAEANRKLEAERREQRKLLDQQEELVGDVAALREELKTLRASSTQGGQQYQYTVDDLDAVLASDEFSEDQKKIARQELRRKDEERYQRLQDSIEQSNAEQKRAIRMQEVAWKIKQDHPHLFPTNEHGNAIRADEQNPHVQAFRAEYQRLEREAKKQNVPLNPDDLQRVANDTFFALPPAERAKLMGASISDEDEEAVTDTHLEGSHVPRVGKSQPARFDEQFITDWEKRSGRKIDRKSLAERIKKQQEEGGRMILGLR